MENDDDEYAICRLVGIRFAHGTLYLGQVKRWSPYLVLMATLLTLLLPVTLVVTQRSGGICYFQISKAIFRAHRECKFITTGFDRISSNVPFSLY